MLKLGKKKDLGIELSGEKRECKSNLRFADVMMAASLKQLKNDRGLQKKYRGAGIWNPPRQNTNPDKPEN